MTLPVEQLSSSSVVTRTDNICWFCGKGERPPERTSCEEGNAFLVEGSEYFYLDVHFFRFSAMLAARQMGFRGEYVRAIARDVDRQRIEIWGEGKEH